jgi:hypothetical protein
METCRLLGMCEDWKILEKIQSGRTSFLRSGGVAEMLL